MYRLLLLVFPADFRRRFGDDMSAVFEDRRREARASGVYAVAELWARTVVDVVAHGLAEWRAAERHGMPGRQGETMVPSIVQDVRYALRGFRHRPGFTAVALATLALGIGANTAIFSVVEAVLLRPLPYPDEDRIVRIYETNRRYDFTRGVASPFNFDVWEREAQSFRHLAAIRTSSATLAGAGEPARIRVQRVIPSFFDVMGVPPAHGRVISREDAAMDRPVAVLSHNLWTTRFGADPAIVGSTITLDDEALAIIGVMPHTFTFPAGSDVYRPLDLPPASREAIGSWYLGVVARLGNGATLESAQAEMDAISARLETLHPKQRADRGVHLVSLHDDLTERVAGGLTALQGIVVFVLLIACANVTNLVLAGTSARRREIGIRVSIGAGRSRLVRQLLTENIILALGGAVAGLAIGLWGVRVLVGLAPGGLLPPDFTVGLSATVLAFTTIIAVVTGLAAGLAPAWLYSKADVVDVLRDGGAASTGTGRRTQRLLRAGLVTAEVALALVLVTGALLLGRSFARLTSQDPGFAADRLLTAHIALPASRYADPGVERAFWTALLDRLRASPGIVAAAGSTALPFSNWEWQTWFEVEGRPSEATDGTSVRTVTPGYFATLGIPLALGREFDERDRSGDEPVVVVNEAFARRFLSGNPVGQRIRTERPGAGESSSVLIGASRGPDYSARWMTVVGLAASSRHTRLDVDPQPEIYRPLGQASAGSLILALRAAGDPRALAPVLRSTVRELDAALPIDAVRTMDDAIGATTARRQFDMSLVLLFAGLAASLAVAGIYGVMAFVVGLRTREAGIRLALGASPARVQMLIVRRGLVPVVAGIALGVAGALALGGLLRQQLFQIEASDPGTLTLSSIAFGAVALLASWLPARRAGKADPVSILRAD